MTLRHAIESANSNPGPDVINFDPLVFPPNDPVTITLGNALPEIKGQTTIDGSGAGVIIDGSGLDGGEVGLAFSSGSSSGLSDVTVMALTVQGFGGSGILVCGGALPACERDVSTLRVTDVISTSNSGNGFEVAGRAINDVRFQGCSATENAGYGVLVDSAADSNDIELNSCAADRNSNWGVFVRSQAGITDFSLIDSSVSDNQGLGAYLDSVEETVRPRIDNVVATGNSQMGIGFSSAQPLRDLTFVDSTIDGNGSLAGNGLGSEVLAFEIVNATVTGNSFSNNVASSPFGGVGFQIYSQFARPSNLTITENTFNGNVGPGLSIITDVGGYPPAPVSLIADNEVSANTADGISIYESGPITISRNRTFGNQKLGINLKGGEDEEDQTGVTPNDSGDVDSGANELLNFPLVTGMAGDSVQGTACSGCTVEVFLSDNDPSGHGEGKTFLASGTATGGSFSVPVSGPCSGDFVTATATDSDGNTSEFSLNFEVSSDTEGCGPGLLWGDSDCDGEISSRDNQGLLRKVLDQSPLSQTEPCPDLGEAVDAGGTDRAWGDLDCDGSISSRDNQALLRKVLDQAPLSQTEPCPDPGDPV